MITVDFSLTAYRVTGLDAGTCAHCVDSVRVELIRVPGVVGVDLDPAAGKVSVLSDGDVDAAAVREAIEAAGCDIAAC
ncbi:MAG TPA: heavy metal-associated domain-containing protein [Phytomonospora sp.]